MRALLALAVPVLVAACGGDASGQPDLSPAAAEGRQIAARAGCAACHGPDGDGGTGPAWSGSLGTEIELDDGTTVTVDEPYLARSIADPDAQVRDGFSIQMPRNQLSDDEIAKVVAYIVELNEETTG
jgi:cytochrome c oxidase subunit 2